MTIWSAEIKELETLFPSIKGRFPELEKDLEHLIKTDDENVALLYSRRCLEIIVTDLCESELKRPRKTEPLKGIIDKLRREEKVPSHIITSMDHLNSLSTYGTHPKEFDPEQVRPILLNLATIIKWYVKYKDTQIISQEKPGEAKYESKEPVDAREGIRKPKKKLILLLSGLLLGVAIVVVALFVFNIIGSKTEIKETEKSIAVLPFTLLSDEPDKQYLADGMMDAIVLHLSKIKDLRVMSRTSTLQYRVPDKTMTEIGRELGVSYLLEGSFQKYGNNARLIVQLIKTGKEGHVWANEYDRNWNDILSVQSEVAKTVARELHTVITPEEQELIEKVPTTDLTAYDLYMKANSYREDYSKTRNLDSYQKAVSLYLASIDIDSAFAKAYTGLAFAYWDRNYYETYLKENFMDSCLVLANIALSFDDQLDEAYYLKGRYYYENAQNEEAMDNFEKALKINPNYYSAYSGKGDILTLVINDYVKGLETFYKALALISGDERPSLLRNLSESYRCVGFFDKAKDYNQEAFILDGDSISYFDMLAYLEYSLGNFENAILFAEKASKIDTTYRTCLECYSISERHQEAYIAAKKIVEQLKKSVNLPLIYSHRIGYAFWKVGKYKEAEHYFNEQIKYGIESIKLGRSFASTVPVYYDLAATYAFSGDINKAYQYLDEFNTMNFYPSWLVSLSKQDPLFDSIRNEERFQKILQNMEAKYQAEHERVRKWLEEQGMLSPL
jgi:TolB-like protein/Tfp pilus assembly protein PilF